MDLGISGDKSSSSDSQYRRDSMVKIGVISDSHFMAKKVRLPEQIISSFKGVDRIFHAGDIISPQVLAQLSAVAPVTAVKGNMDTGRDFASLPETVVEGIEGVKIGLIHGWGPPKGITDRIRKRFPDDIDCIVFGHTHTPMNEVIDGVYFFNPGASFDKIYSLFNSVGILYVDNGDIKGEIIELYD